jgi:hypothetical protein
MLIEKDSKRIKKQKGVKESTNNLITEYVETGEGEGISIIPLNEKEMDIDGENLITEVL